MNCIFILFRGKNSVLWVPSSPVVFPGFVRDCRVFAVFAGFTDNTSGASAYQVGSEMVRFLQELPQNLQQYVPTGKGASRFIRLTWIKIYTGTRNWVGADVEDRSVFVGHQSLPSKKSF